LAADGLTGQQISSVLLSISSLGSGVSGAMKEMAAVAVANAVDKVFYVPLASGIAAWLVAMVTEWRKIQKAEEPVLVIEEKN
jgi:methylglyoxal synthase